MFLKNILMESIPLGRHLISSSKDSMEEIVEEEVGKVVATKEMRQIYRFKYKSKRKGSEEELTEICKKKFEIPVECWRPVKDTKKKKKLETVGLQEHTLLIVKPVALPYLQLIKDRVYQEGFTALKERTLWLTPEEMSEFYSEHYGKPWFPKCMSRMTAGPIHVIVLGKENAVEDLRKLVGHERVSIARKKSPYSLRALYGLKGDSATNGFHASENREKASREVKFFFNLSLPEPIKDLRTVAGAVEELCYPIAPGLDCIRMEKPPRPLVYLSEFIRTLETRLPTVILPSPPQPIKSSSN